MTYLFNSPLGPISYEWDGNRCHRVMLESSSSAECGEDPVSRWLAAYFDREITSLPPLAEPATPFQQIMRQALLNIPSGEVRTYGELAHELKTSPRAMGQALGANPLPILIPCHRVIAADGLGGFACGIDWKKKLLQFERRK
ncbi:methylated-DNA-[protein]-cysteine S-methyltransferase [Mariprofundus ferrinatatus]|uniref:Methylated-DNA-[protein]-cysteine S-methyltransferase n=1 Tax=Mariprofundus ferrinatatus TaxID=1921087 RepID=A0A2K8L9Y5_9PROT|nr:methylated-DNA--[protein]-cysteine S-methyltransferase [Mariprofundus ferrinatatus]ATX81086.1 methylated-DNA-[protein]-cysteine S-methyltransferase [Mariprofundus ferrinatatus]